MGSAAKVPHMVLTHHGTHSHHFAALPMEVQPKACGDPGLGLKTHFPITRSLATVGELPSTESLPSGLQLVLFAVKCPSALEASSVGSAFTSRIYESFRITSLFRSMPPDSASIGLPALDPCYFVDESIAA